MPEAQGRFVRTAARWWRFPVGDDIDNNKQQTDTEERRKGKKCRRSGSSSGESSVSGPSPLFTSVMPPKRGTPKKSPAKGKGSTPKTIKQSTPKAAQPADPQAKTLDTLSKILSGVQDTVKSWESTNEASAASLASLHALAEQLDAAREVRSSGSTTCGHCRDSPAVGAEKPWPYSSQKKRCRKSRRRMPRTAVGGLSRALSYRIWRSGCRARSPFRYGTVPSTNTPIPAYVRASLHQHILTLFVYFFVLVL